MLHFPTEHNSLKTYLSTLDFLWDVLQETDIIRLSPNKTNFVLATLQQRCNTIKLFTVVEFGLYELMMTANLNVHLPHIH